MKTLNKKISSDSKLKGWGIDADPSNDPTYPMKHRTNEEHKGYSWTRPKLQSETVEVLHSNERPNLTAVFGTSTPPKGLSGMIRRFAFRYSENSYLHWLPLLMADRVNMIEGLLSDLRRGYIPRYAAEKGWGVLWKYNPKKFLARAATTALTVAGFAALFFRKKNTMQKA